MLFRSHGEVVRLQAARETADCDLAQHTQLARDLSLEDHADRDALSVQHRGRKHGFDSMADSVAKIDKVAQASLALVDSDNVRLDSDRPGDDREEQLLCGRARRLRAPCKVG